jgi:hypothetical protein
MPIPTIYFNEKKINNIHKFLDGPLSPIRSTLSETGNLGWAAWSYCLTDNSFFHTFSSTKRKFLSLKKFSHREVAKFHHSQEAAKNGIFFEE